MRIGILSYYYNPDLSAGSFRMQALVYSLLKKAKNIEKITVVCSSPSRYDSYQVSAKELEFNDKLQIIRIPKIIKNSNFFFVVLNYFFFSLKALKAFKNNEIDLIIGTSSRLMTCLLTNVIATSLNKKYFLDIRDIFIQNIEELFFFKKYFFIRPFIFLLKKIERKAIINSIGTNLVSEGFKIYFENIDKKFTFYTNGIDQNFIKIFPLDIKKNKKKFINIIYAGNIGLGQSLDKIIPYIAKENNNYRFTIIGDGGRKKILIKKILDMNLENVKFLEPMSQNNLFKYYDAADILFLNLNNHNSLSFALPSKVFEYSIIGKPIVAGVKGFTKEFLQKNISHCITFEPNNHEACIKAINKSLITKVKRKDIEELKQKFSREKIMDQMSKNILDLYSYEN